MLEKRQAKWGLTKTQLGKLLAEERQKSLGEGKEENLSEFWEGKIV